MCFVVRPLFRVLWLLLDVACIGVGFALFAKRSEQAGNCGASLIIQATPFWALPTEFVATLVILLAVTQVCVGADGGSLTMARVLDLRFSRVYLGAQVMLRMILCILCAIAYSELPFKRPTGTDALACSPAVYNSIPMDLLTNVFLAALCVNIAWFACLIGLRIAAAVDKSRNEVFVDYQGL